MDPKALAEQLRVMWPACWADWNELADFLDQLPQIEGHELVDWRVPVVGETYRTDDDAVVRCGGKHTGKRWILRKLPPKFKPGDIVIRGTDACRVVTEGGRTVLFGGLPSEVLPSECRLATDKEVWTSLRTRPYSSVSDMRLLLRDRYGEGEE